MKLLAKSLLFFLISSKKFQAKTKTNGFLSFNLSFLNKCDEIERDIVKEYYQRCFDIDLGITKNLEAS